MASNSLAQQIAAMRQSLLDEEIVNSQFILLDSLASDDDPDFAQTMFDAYIEETQTLLASVEKEMAKTPVDYTTLWTFFHKLRASCATLGANKVLIEVDATRKYCHDDNIEGAKAALERVKGENGTLKAKIDPYFELVKQARVSGQNVDPKW